VIGGGGDGEIVGEQRAGAVELLAGQPVAAAISGQQAGGEDQAADRQRALLAERVAEDLALGDLVQPSRRAGVACGAQPLLGEPKCVRKI
jgi:hypothetical protein